MNDVVNAMMHLLLRQVTRIRNVGALYNELVSQCDDVLRKISGT